MQNINGELYRTNIFYRDLVDKMLANEKEKEKEQQIRQLKLEQQIRFDRDMMSGYDLSCHELWLK